MTTRIPTRGAGGGARQRNAPRRCRVLSTFLLLFLFASPWPASAAGDGPSASLGAGLGIPYGLAGVNGEFELPLGRNATLGPTVGLGSAGPAGLGWAVGLQTHFLPQEGLFRIGACVWYGTNTLVEKESWDGDSEFESRTGWAFGLNGRFQFGEKRRHGLDLFLLYVVLPDLSDEYEEEGSPVKVGVGYVFRF